MTLVDGYRATYKIRNAAEFANPRLQGTPIVAMTASAIQGDREKCQMSGMDDYLAKPVKKPNLERMLVKWAIEGRKKREELLKDSSKVLRPHNPRAPSSFETNVSSIESPEDHIMSELDRLEFTHRNALERSSETADGIAMRKHRAEEKAMALRDDMLIQSAEDPKDNIGRTEHSLSTEASEPVDTSHWLTSENMQKLYGGDDRAGRKDWNRMSTDVEVSNAAAEASTTPASLAPSSSTISRPPKKSPLGIRKPD